MRRALVTGAAGFAGRHVVERLLRDGDWVVTTLDARPHEWNASVTPLVHDLSEPLSLKLVRALEDIDVVVHLAAASDVDQFLVHPVELLHRNVAATTHLLEWARAQRVTRFVQVSTNEVYGPSRSGPPDPWGPIVPTTPYSASKAAQEAAAVAWWSSYEVPVVIANTISLFGEHQQRKKFIPTVVERVLAHEPVRLVRDAVRTWTYVGDHADALVHLLQVDLEDRGDRPPRFHVAGVDRTVGEVLAAVVKRLDAWEVDFDRDVLAEDVPARRPGHGDCYVLRENVPRWHPPFGFEAGLDRTVGWLLKART